MLHGLLNEALQNTNRPAFLHDSTWQQSNHLHHPACLYRLETGNQQVLEKAPATQKHELKLWGKSRERHSQDIGSHRNGFALQRYLSTPQRHPKNSSHFHGDVCQMFGCLDCLMMWVSALLFYYNLLFAAWKEPRNCRGFIGSLEGMDINTQDHPQEELCLRLKERSFTKFKVAPDLISDHRYVSYHDPTKWVAINCQLRHINTLW